jgi:hypothetical protein
VLCALHAGTHRRTDVRVLACSLRVCAARRCRLTGALPRSLGRLLCLREMHLNSNALQGAIPTSYW